MLARPPNRALQRCLDELGWRPESLAARLNDYARRQGCNAKLHVKTPYSWLLHGRQPREPWGSFVAAVLGESLGRAVPLEELGWARPRSMVRVPADSGLKEPWDEASILTVLGELGSETLYRRCFLSVSAHGLAQPVHKWMLEADRLRSVFDQQAAVDSVVMDSIESLVDVLRRQDDVGCGDVVLTAARAQLRTIARLLRGSRPLGVDPQRLYAVAAELSRLTAWVLFDRGEQARAQRAFLIALQAAHHSSRPELGANVLNFLALQLSATGRSQDGLTVLRSAMMGADRAIESAQRAALHANVARLSAKLDDALAVNNAVEATFEQAAKIGEHIPAHIYWVDEAHLSSMVGQAYLDLGDFARAEEYLTVGVTKAPATKLRERAIWLCALATVHLRQNNVEQACAVATQSLDLAFDFDSPRVTGQIAALRRELSAYQKLYVVREFDEQAQGFFADRG